MTRSIFSHIPLMVAGLVVAAGPALAGGFERDDQDFDILFLDGAQTEAGVSVVLPDRHLDNIRGSVAAEAPPAAGGLGGINPATGEPFETSVGETEAFVVPKFSAKFDLTNDLACAGQYRTPWGGHTDVGTGTVLSLTAIEQEITSKDFGLNCSYRFSLGPGYFRALAGGSIQQLGGEQTRLLPAGTVGIPTTRIGTLDVDDTGYGWRAGLAYEVPEIALRAQLVYQSEVDYTLDGTVGNLFAAPVDVAADATLPQSVELKLQSGVAPGWLAFGSAKWVDWSIEDAITFKTSQTYFGGAVPEGTPITRLNLYYRDGWTLTGGVGHKITDRLSLAGTLTWDRGVTQGLSSQTDTWTVGLGSAFTPRENLEIRFAGALGVLTGGTRDDRVIAGNPNLTGSVADFGDDLVGALSLSAKFKF